MLLNIYTLIEAIRDMLFEGFSYDLFELFAQLLLCMFSVVIPIMYIAFAVFLSKERANDAIISSIVVIILQIIHSAFFREYYSGYERIFV